MAQVESDIADLKSLEEKKSHLEREGVHQDTMKKIIGIVERAQGALVSAVSEDEKEAAKTRARNELEAAMIWRDPHKNPAWEKLEQRYVKAATAHNEAALGAAMVAICDQSNLLFRNSREAMNGRVSRLLSEFGQGAVSPLPAAAAALWR